MKKIYILIFSLLIFSSCVRYDTRQSNFLFDGKGPQWLVYRNAFYIPEYTQTGKGEFAATEEEARRLFELRQPAIESLLWEKYEKPKRQAFDYVYGSTFFILGPVIDILYMPVAWTYSAIHKTEIPADEKWFPFTKAGTFMVFYGPTSWPLFGPVSLAVKESWKQNPELEKNLENILGEKK